MSAEEDPFRALFNSLDVDNDGKLSISDLRSATDGFSQDKLEEIMAKLDTTGSGSLTFDEFKDGFDIFFGGSLDEEDDDTAANTYSMQSLETTDEEEMALGLPTQPREDVETLFRSLDSDGDGFVTYDDLRSILPAASVNDLRKLINLMDRTRRGSVSVDEFYQGFNHIVNYQREHAEEERLAEIAEDEDETPEAPPLAPTAALAPSIGMKKRTSISDIAKGRTKFDDTIGALGDDDNTLTYEDDLEEKDDIDDEDASHTRYASLDQFDDKTLDKDTQIDLLKQRIRKMRVKTINAEKKFKMLSNVGGQIEEENQTLSDELAEAQTSLRWARDEIKELRDSTEAFKKMIKSLQVRELTLSSKVKDVEEEEKIANERLSEEQQQSAMLKQHIAAMEEELNALKSGRSADNFSKYKSKLAGLRGNLDVMKQKKLRDAENRVVILEEENGALKEKIGVLVDEIEQLKSIIEGLKRDIEELNRKLAMAGNAGSLAIQMEEEEASLKPQKPKAKPDEPEQKAQSRKQLAATMLQSFKKTGTVRLDPSKITTAQSQDDITQAKRPARRHMRNLTFNAQSAKQLLAVVKENRDNPPSPRRDRDKSEKQRALDAMERQRILDQEAELVRERREKSILQQKNEELERKLALLLEAQHDLERKREQEAEQVLRQSNDVILTEEAQAEVTAYAKYINHVLRDDSHLKHVLPVKEDTGDLLLKLRDGWILAQFLNFMHPNTVDLRVLHVPPKDGTAPLSEEHALDNLQLCIESCKGVGVQMAGITREMIFDSYKHPLQVIDCLWRVIRAQLLYKVNVEDKPELVKLITDPAKESAMDLMRMERGDLLMRWFNYHQKNAIADASIKAAIGNEKAIFHFEDWGDATILRAIPHCLTFSQTASSLCSPDTIAAVAKQADTAKRAETMLGVAKDSGIHPATMFLNPHVMTRGGPVAARLTLAFTASVFLNNNGLGELSAEELKHADLMEDDVGDNREERAFRMWINSMGIPLGSDAMYIHNLFGDCKDGLVLLRVMDHIRPGIVNWKKVELKPTNKFKMVSNCNYVVELCQKRLQMKLVGIGGTDLTEGNKKLTLAIVWQLMHMHISQFLMRLYKEKFGTKAAAPASRRMSVREQKDHDTLIVEWACKRIDELTEDQKAKVAGPLKATAFSCAYQPMRTFGDSHLSDCLFYLHLMWAVEPRVVDWTLCTEGNTQEDKFLNARYAISVARKLGATIFLLPEDLVEVKAKMVTIFVGAILAVDHMKAAAAGLGSVTVSSTRL